MFSNTIPQLISYCQTIVNIFNLQFNCYFAGSLSSQNRNPIVHKISRVTTNHQLTHDREFQIEANTLFNPHPNRNLASE
jgi:hypothetical protein